MPSKVWVTPSRLEMDNSFHHTLYNGCNYLSILELQLNPVSKRDLWEPLLLTQIS